MNDTQHFLFSFYTLIQHSFLIAFACLGILFYQYQRLKVDGFQWKNIFSFNSYIHVLLILYNAVQSLRGGFGAVYSFDSKYDYFSIIISTFLYYIKDGFLLVIFIFHTIQIVKYNYSEIESLQKSSTISYVVFFLLFFLISVVSAIIKILTINIIIATRGIEWLQYHQGTLVFELFVIISLIISLFFFIFMGYQILKKGEQSLKFIISFTLSIEAFILFITHKLCYIIMLSDSKNRLLYEFVSLFNRLNGIVLTFGIIIFYWNNNGLREQESIEQEEEK